MLPKNIGLKSLLFYIRDRLYRVRNLDYGIFDAFFFPKAMDQWTRYADITRDIQDANLKGRRIKSVLDVGAAEGRITNFLNPLIYDITIVDVQRTKLNKKSFVETIVGDGCKLPFRNKVFDATISVDTYEHIPKGLRSTFLGELQRVCKKRLILHFPLQSDNGYFSGGTYDIKFQHLFKQLYGFEEANTAEHIKSIHPNLNEVKNIIPQAEIRGSRNCVVWLKYKVMSLKRVRGFLAGIFYCLFLKKSDSSPPYWGCMIICDFEEQ